MELICRVLKRFIVMGNKEVPVSCYDLAYIVLLDKQKGCWYPGRHLLLARRRRKFENFWETSQGDSLSRIDQVYNRLSGNKLLDDLANRAFAIVKRTSMLNPLG